MLKQVLNRKISLERGSRARLAIAAAFLFFVFYSTPHRVHHFFEQAPAEVAHDHSGESGAANEQNHDRHPPNPQRTDCAAQMAAQNTHLASVAVSDLAFRQAGCGAIEPVETAWADAFNPSPFSQRAPPLA